MVGMITTIALIVTCIGMGVSAAAAAEGINAELDWRNAVKAFRRHLESGDLGPCPGCGAEWENKTTHYQCNHPPFCSYMAWLDEEEND